MTRDELAQVVRDQISRAVSNALTSGVPSIGILRRCEETILRAADEYGAGLSGDTARGIKALEAFRDGQAIAAARKGRR